MRAVSAGRGEVGEITCWPAGRLNWMAQGTMQAPEFASRMAWRSVRLPLSALLCTLRLETLTTVTLAEAVLFDEIGSPSVAVTLAVAVSVPPPRAFTVMAAVMVRPTPRDGAVHTTLLPDGLQVRPLATLET